MYGELSFLPLPTSELYVLGRLYQTLIRSVCFSLSGSPPCAEHWFGLLSRTSCTACKLTSLSCRAVTSSLRASKHCSNLQMD